MADSNSADRTAPNQTEPDLFECVVAIDPGRAKCGLAVVRRNGDAPFRSVVLTTNIAAELMRVISVYRPCEIVVGNGTGSITIIEVIRATATSTLPIRTVPEAFTSEEARKRYVKETKPRGLQRLLPAALRTPPHSYDDYVAVILGERYWENCCDKSGTRANPQNL